MGIFQYIKDTRSEMRHVAWPTRVQTVIFTVLVIAVSALVALYLGLFDFLFTSVLTEGLEYVPQSASGDQAPLEIVELDTAIIEDMPVSESESEGESAAE